MKYIMIWPYGWFDSYMYRDLVVNHMVIPLCIDKPSKSRIMNLLRRIHHSYKVNGIINLPYKDIWYKYLYKALSQLADKNTCIIFDTGAIANLSINDLIKIKGIGKNTKMILVIVDSMHGSSVHMFRAIPKILNYDWDLILSYDKNDCREYNFEYIGQSIYSKLDDVIPSRQVSDIYFVGKNKAGRNKDILKIYEKFQQAGVVTNFNLIDSKTNIHHSQFNNSPGIYLYCQNIPYETVISDVLSSNCILEVVASGQKAQTARYYEAVCYNKKLLTNNVGVFELPFYDSRYMKYFETVSDIDFDWVRRKEKIDYHYNNEFSPVYLLDKIANKIKDDEKNYVD